MTTLLIIEDEPILREEVTLWLEMEGYTVFAAPNGREGIARAKEHLPDLVICDINMPEMDGYEVLAAMQAEDSLATTPFVFLTALSDPTMVREGMNLGADDYLTKPFRKNDLIEAIQIRLKKHQAVASKAAQSVEALKNTLVRTVAHELNTPMISVEYIRETIETEIDQLDPAETKELMKILEDGTARLRHLVDQTMTLVQIEAGAVTTESLQETKALVDVIPLLNDAVALARRYAYRNKDAVVVIDPAQAHRQIYCDRKLTRQALTELLINAINFSPQGGPVKIKHGQTDDAVWINVIDSGEGMSDAEIEHAMERFGQNEREEREQQGMGLGLNVAQHILRLHHTTLDIQSVKGGGTRAAVRFPLTN